jgi:hypothetical protein
MNFDRIKREQKDKERIIEEKNKEILRLRMQLEEALAHTSLEFSTSKIEIES